MATEWSIQEVARLAGTTSRTLRHYGELGLLPPTRVGSNGYRYYDEAALRRLQRILLLRSLGVGLAAIGEALDGQDDVTALSAHLVALREERELLERRIRSVEATIAATREGRPLMAEEMLDGFDHTVHEAEVTSRWGAQAYADGDAWWRGMSEAEREDWQRRQAALAADWKDAAAAGEDPAGPRGQALARRQAEWLAAIPGIPAVGPEYLRGLGEMYVADERFAANYGGVVGATFVRDALAAYAESPLVE